MSYRHHMRAILTLSLFTAAAAMAADPAASPASGVDSELAEAKRCVAMMDRLIARQREIGREVGIVDKSTLYLAGSSKVSCQRDVDRLTRCRRAGKCEPKPVDPYAPTRVPPVEPTARTP